MKRFVQREAILEELRSLSCHPTADELHRRLKERMPHLSLATVYRNLEQFSRAGLVLKLDCGGEMKRFDGNVMPHPHIRCPECGAVADVDDLSVFELHERLLALLPILKCDTMGLEFSGRCQICKQQQNEVIL
ncbi:MAG: transcriptional repressor [Lentisphaeria bacterium]|nr:transcriptional repressor [Lentisphaeria bacterium]